MWLKKNIIFNEFIYFNLKEFKESLKNIIIITKTSKLLITLLDGFILEDFKEEEIENIIEVIPPF